MKSYAKIYPIVGGLIDVFIGEGWEDWSRLFVDKTGNATHMGGNKLPKWIMREIGSVYARAR